MMRRLQAGSPFLLFLIRLSSSIFGVTGLTLIALAIWLWTSLHKFNVIEIAFIGLGVFEVILFSVIISAKKSISKLRCSLIFLSVLFIVELIVSILAFALGSSIIQSIVDQTGAQDEYDKLKSYLLWVTIFVIVCIAIEFLLIVLIYCYIGSLKNRNHYYDYKTLNSEGEVISVQEKKDIETNKIKEEYSNKRQEMKSKYGLN